MSTSFDATAQRHVDLVHQGYLQDSFNMRLHMDAGKMGNIISEPFPTLEPERNMLQLFRHEGALPKDKTTVHIRHYDLQNPAMWGNDMRPSTIAGKIENWYRYGRLEDEVQLQYDKQGYITKRTGRNYHDDSLISSYDTTLYTYTTAGNGNILITTDRRHTAINSRIEPRDGISFSSHQFCGPIKRGPVTYRDKNQTVYEITPDGKMLRQETTNEKWVNSCRDDDSQTYIVVNKYDSKGRLLTNRYWTSRMKQPPTSTVFTYEDAPLTTTPILNTPLMRQYLSTIDSPYLSRVTYAYHYWLTPENIIYPEDHSEPDYKVPDTFITVRDAKHKLRLSYGVPLPFQDTMATLYRICDSKERYASHMSTIYANAGYDDTAVYKPTPESMYETEGKPDGTFYVSRVECKFRNSYTDNSGWRMVCYGDDSGSGTFVSPKSPQCGCGWGWELYRYFLIIDPKGIVRYVYDDTDMYLITYE